MTEWLECRDCKRPLTSAESRQLGYGPECARRRGLTPKKPRRLTGPTRRPRPTTVRGNDDPVPVIPGQTELPLALHQPSLWSL